MIFLKKLPTRASIRNTWLHRRFGDSVLREEFWVPSRHSLALGLALGWLIGLLPVYGLQIVLSLLLGFALRCHLPTAVLGTFITNPFTTPAILILQYKFGQWLCGYAMPGLERFTPYSPLLRHGIPLALGAGASSILAAVIGYLVGWILWSFVGRKSAADGEVV
jgi:uncharacterized protein (DUF2062 family)